MPLDKSMQSNACSKTKPYHRAENIYIERFKVPFPCGSLRKSLKLLRENCTWAAKRNGSGITLFHFLFTLESEKGLMVVIVKY